MDKIDNYVVLVTGALTGIGRAAAEAFAQQGNRIVIAGRRADVGQAFAADLRGMGAETEFITADVRHEEEVRNLVDRRWRGLVDLTSP